MGIGRVTEVVGELEKALIKTKVKYNSNYSRIKSLRKET